MEKIKTLKPDGTEGVSIDKNKYDLVKKAILDSLKENGPQPFKQLLALANEKLTHKIDGSVSWYFTTVKLDLETKGEIKVDKSQNPVLISL